MAKDEGPKGQITTRAPQITAHYFREGKGEAANTKVGHIGTCIERHHVPGRLQKETGAATAAAATAAGRAYGFAHGESQYH
jgi:hypothetical protein